ncbi:MAG: hypothetical protein ACRYG8_12380 [Janthinobacterium lividum]
MHGYLSSLDDDAPCARPVLALLAQNWPESISLRPDTIDALAENNDRQHFVRTIQFLNDHGYISFDALLIGAEALPHVIGAFITRRGQQLYSMIRTAGMPA